MNGDSLHPSDTISPGTGPDVDPRHYLRVLWRWKWIFIAIMIVIPVGVYMVVSRQTKIYQSSAILEVQPAAVDTSQFSAGGAPSADQILNAVAALIDTTGVARQAAKDLHPRPAHARSLLGNVTATADTNTGFITVTATAGSPQLAADTANAFAAAISVKRAQQSIASLNNAIKELTLELNSQPPPDRTVRADLRREIGQDSALRAAQGSNAQVVQPALVNPSPISPRVRTARAPGSGRSAAAGPLSGCSGGGL